MKILAILCNLLLVIVGVIIGQLLFSLLTMSFLKREIKSMEKESDPTPNTIPEGMKITVG